LAYYKDCMVIGTPIEFKVIGVIALAFIIGGYFGSKIAIKIDQELLKKIFAVILFYTGIKMLQWDDAFIRWIKNLFPSMTGNFLNITDQEILDRFYKDHDNKLLGILFQRYTLLLFGSCMKYLKNE